MVGAPSYTSMLHWWNGAAETLKSKAVAMNRIPMVNPEDTSSGVWSIPETNLANSSKLVVPVNPYTKEHPNSNNPDENAPRMKYFNPDSVENAE